MDAALVTLVVVVIAALAFDYINGFHDAANAVATVVSTGVLPLRAAVLGAAVLNFVGAFAGTGVAKTIGTNVLASRLLDPALAAADPSLRLAMQAMVLAALAGAIFWNLFTWYFGIPSSSSHALIGGLVGAGIARAGFDAVKGEGVALIFTWLVVSPIVGAAIGFVIMLSIFWICRHRKPHRVSRRFRRLQLFSASFMAFSHGSNDAQKSMGVITMALVAYGAVKATAKSEFPIPYWVIIGCAVAMGLGTAAGGVRIIKTMGTKIIDLRPPQGFAAETSAALTIYGATLLKLPVSTTHVISGAIMGVGASRSISSVRWGVTAKIVWAWVLTIPITALVAAGCYLLGARLLVS